MCHPTRARSQSGHEAFRCAQAPVRPLVVSHAIASLARAIRRLLTAAILAISCLEAHALDSDLAPPVNPSGYFRIHVIDGETRRGVPLVELRTVNGISHFTDSAGMVAFFEPGMMNRDIFFRMTSHGYTMPKDELGAAGHTVRTTPGTSATVEIHRDNIAERLYRITGQGIYADSVLLGDQPPIAHPLINSRVDGQDSVLVTQYRGRLFWVWGDTLEASGSAAGNYKVTGAWSDLPTSGGLDPEVGVNLEYLPAGEFVKEMVPKPTDHELHWIGSLFVVNDKGGRPRMMAFCSRVEAPLRTKGNMLLEFNDETQAFDVVVPEWPKDALKPQGHVVRLADNGADHFCFPAGGGFVRVRADYDSVRDPQAYEGWSFLKEGYRVERSSGKITRMAAQIAGVPGAAGDDPTSMIERDRGGALVWGWKRNTSPVGQRAQEKLEGEGLMSRAERTFDLHAVDTGKPVSTHASSVFYNEWRKRWTMVLCESGGSPSQLGELWYAEADRLQGPYVYARKIITHDRYSFYNPLQHPEFSKDGGRVTYFEGTYTTWFTGLERGTPRYDYNQIMYKLELDDERLSMPVAVYRIAADGKARHTTADKLPADARLGEPAFYAFDRPWSGSVPVTEVAGDGAALEAHPVGADTKGAAFFALPADTAACSAMTAPLYKFSHAGSGERVYGIDPPDAGPQWVRADKPLCTVWRNPLATHPEHQPEPPEKPGKKAPKE